MSSSCFQDGDSDIHVVEVLKEGFEDIFFFFKSFNVSCAMPGSDPVKNNALTHDGIILFLFVRSV